MKLTAALTKYAATGVKEVLYLAQNKKCVWCERRRDLSSSPLEHYRPKDGAWRHQRGAKPARIDRGHYWWLTWTWTNLYHACGRCNDMGHKANFFRLEPNTKPRARPRRTAKHPLADRYFERSSTIYKLEIR